MLRVWVEVEFLPLATELGMLVLRLVESLVVAGVLLLLLLLLLLPWLECTTRCPTPPLERAA